MWKRCKKVFWTRREESVPGQLAVAQCKRARKIVLWPAICGETHWRNKDNRPSEVGRPWICGKSKMDNNNNQTTGDIALSVFLCVGKSLVLIKLLPFSESRMRFGGECRPLLGGLAMENPEGCGSLAAPTNERGRKEHWKNGFGADFCCRLLLMEEYFLCFLGRKRRTHSFLGGEIEQWEHWQTCI